MQLNKNEGLKLYAPDSYWKATDEEKAAVCNGCGAKGGIKVPDSFLGLEIKKACNIHDWMTEEGQTLGDFLFAAVMFLANLAAIILSDSNRFVRIIRMILAFNYFTGVLIGGRSHFFKNKTENKKMYITYKGSFQ